MKILRQLLQKEGWHLAETGLPIRVGVKFGGSPHGKKHLHRAMVEYFLLVAGSMRICVSGQTIELVKGDMLVIEPGEAHEVRVCSPDALLLLMMPPPVAADKVEL